MRWFINSIRFMFRTWVLECQGIYTCFHIFQNVTIVSNRGRSNLGKNCFAILTAPYSTSHAMIYYYSISLALGGGIVLPI